MANSLTIYTPFFAAVVEPLRATITAGASNVMGAIRPTAITLLTVYIALWAWSMARGLITEPVTDGVTRIVKLAIICAIALQMGHYTSFLIEWLWNGPDALANRIANSDAQSGMSVLDTYLSAFWDYSQVWLKAATANATAFGNIPDILQFVVGIAILVVGGALTAYAAFLYILAKVAIAVMLVLGPIFVALLIFQATSKFFDAWLGQCLNYFFVIVLTAAVLFIVKEEMTRVMGIATAAAGQGNNPSLMDAVQVMGVALICLLFLLQVNQIASALGGGVAVSTMGAAGIAYHRIKSAASSGIKASRWGVRELAGRNRADRRFQAQRRADTTARWKKTRIEERKAREERRRVNTVRKA